MPKLRSNASPEARTLGRTRRCSTLECSNDAQFRCSDVQMLGSSDARTLGDASNGRRLGYSNARMRGCCNAAMLRCWNAQMLRCLECWILGCSDARMLRCSDAWILSDARTFGYLILWSNGNRNHPFQRGAGGSVCVAGSALFHMSLNKSAREAEPLQVVAIIILQGLHT